MSWDLDLKCSSEIKKLHEPSTFYLILILKREKEYSQNVWPADTIIIPAGLQY